MILHPAGEDAHVDMIAVDEVLVVLVADPVLRLQHLDQLILALEHLVTHLLLHQDLLKQLHRSTPAMNRTREFFLPIETGPKYFDFCRLYPSSSSHHARLSGGYKEMSSILADQ